MAHLSGFVDLQVNGYQGVDFSRPGLRLAQVTRVTEELRVRGTIAYCPTVITSSMETYRSNLPILAAACRNEEWGPCLPGIHLEGPFISPEDGARGAHPKEFVTPPDIDQLKELIELAEHQVCLVTLAPELPGADELIGFLKDSGIVVSLGHHLASEEAIVRACEQGATAVTHLGNGIPNLLPRHPNPVWSQLAQESLQIMLITDGHHLPESFIRVVASVKGSKGLIVVSDAAPIAGYSPGRYSTLGQKVILEESGRLWNPKGEHLVGSSASMLDCMNFLARLEIFSEEELIEVGHENPLKLIGSELDESVLESAPTLSFENSVFEIK